ncbi:MAG: DNA polymerase I [Coriobacteriia bacterium]|nr:DNA polymerase I [Coriobacteriia bacterium]
MSDTEQKKTIAVIDGNSLMHRAYHSMPPSLVAPDGRPTNAVSGFLSMLHKLIVDFKPDGVITAFDKGKPQVRIDMLEQYKAQRPKMDEELRVQFPMIHEVIEALDIPIVELEGWEGDDILGTLARLGEEAGYKVLLITGDHDAYQLATEQVSIVANKRGMSEVKIITPEAVQELYGISPDLIPDFYGLKGDSSDNIPGVPGIGEKKASALIQEWGSLENLIEHADEIKGKMGENLRAHIEDARISKVVATIMRDAPVDLDLLDSKFPTFNPDTVREVFSNLGFSSQTIRFMSLAQGEAAQDLEQQALATFTLSPTFEGEEARKFLQRHMAQAKYVGVSFSKTREASLFEDVSYRVFLASEEGVAKLEGEEALKGVQALFERGHIVALDVKALLELLIPSDSSKQQLILYGDINPQDFFDIEIAAYLLDSSRASYSISYLVDKYLGVSLPETNKNEEKEEMLEAAVAFALLPALQEALKKDESLKPYQEIELKLLPALVVCERNGMALDKEVLSQLSLELQSQIEALTSEIYDLSGEQFNIDSPKQLSHVLFEVMNLPVQKKTKTGYSTDASVLEALRSESAIAEKIIEYRERTKLKSTYIDALPKQILEDKRIHTTYNQTVAATGRLSSSDPNLQNIPVRTDLGRQIRRAFVVPEGHVFVSADYSQIELRLLAHLSNDQGLIDAFLHGEDFHSETAAKVFGVTPEEVSSEMRSRAKAVNFGIVYGQQAYGLSTSLGIAYADAQDMIDRYFDIYQGVRSYLDDTVAFAKEHGYVETIFKRKRHIPDIYSRNPSARNFGERTAMNHPMQGSAADIIKLAMIEVQKALVEEGFKSKMIVQVHDELDFEVPLDELEALSCRVEEIMTNIVDLKVPLEVSISSASNWAEAK